MNIRFITFTVLFLGALSLADPAGAACLNGGNSDTIQGTLNASGIAELCQGATFQANKPIRLPTGGKLFTSGYPASDIKKALITVPAGVTYNEPVIQAYTSANAEIRSIKVDGNRSVNGYVYSRALIAISGNNALLDRVRATNTSGLSAIAASDNPNCNGLRITNNYIGSNGFHSGSGSPWANGIDVRCSNAYVANNEIRDATDGAISFYGGRYTVIENNWIANSGRSAYSGIIAANLYAGDFTGAVVRSNLIESCCGQHLHVALSVGTHLWCDDAQNNPDCQFSTGASFLNNSGSGTYGFGIAVDGMYNATIQGNNLIMTPWTGTPCYIPNQNWYVINTAHASGSFQSGYTVRQIHWPCLGPH